MPLLVKITLLSIVALVVSVVLWPFALAGLLAYAVAGFKFNRWISSAFALITVIILRLANDEWMIRIGDSHNEHWLFEVMQGILNWAYAAFFVSGFAIWPVMFLDGLRSPSSVHKGNKNESCTD